MIEMHTLGEFTSLRQGLAINKNTAHLVSEQQNNLFSYPLLRIADMESGKYEKYISKEVQSSVLAKYDDIIYTRTGQIGLAFRGFEGCVHNNSFVVSLISDIISKDYLFALLNSKVVRDQALALAKNSVQPDLTHDMFKSISVPVPDKETQEKIAALFFILNEKIQLNASICTSIEAMAKLLYDYWFIQFDFPDKNGKPYKSSGGKMVWNEELKREIPDGWEIKTIRELSKEGKDRAYTSPKNIPTLDLSVMPSNSMMLGELNESKNFSTNLFEMKKGDILFGSIRPYLKKAGIAPCDGAVAGTVHCFRPIRKEDFNFLAVTLCNERMFSYAISASQGTKMPVVTLDSIKDYKVAYDVTTAKSFNNIDIQNVMSVCILENQQLAALRDFLLPMLMNGQVKIEKEASQ